MFRPKGFKTGRRCLVPISGDIETMPVVELLQWAGGNRKTGVLELERKKIRKRIILRDGRIVGCSSDDPATRLGQLLISSGKISRQTLADALRQQAETRQTVPDILVETGALTRDEIIRQVHEQAEETICGMFAWDDAVFTFRAGGEPGRHSIEVDLSIEHTLLEGARRQDDLERFREVFSSSGIVLGRTERPLPTDLEDDVTLSRILELLDGKRTLAEVLLQAHVSEYRALSLLYELHGNGNVEVVAERRIDNQQGIPRLQLPRLGDVSESPDIEAVVDQMLEWPTGSPDPAGPEDATSPKHSPDPADLQLLVRAASQKIDAGDHESALAILEACYAAQPADEAVKRQIRRAEASYVESVGKDLLPPEATPSKTDSSDAASRNLTPIETTLLGLIDGRTTIESILSMAPLRRFQVMWTLQRLLKKGLIRL